MTLQTTYVEGPGYLIVEVRGQWEQRDAEEAIEAIRDEAIKCGQTRIFLDLRGLVPPRDGMTRFVTGEHIAKHWGHPFRVVSLWTREYYNGFAETVAVNRGASIRVFFEKAEALDWLLKESNKTDAGGGG